MLVQASWNVMAHAQKPDFVFRRNGRVQLNRRGRQFSRLLAVDVCASAVVMLDTPCSEVVWRVLATHFIRQFSLHFPSRASPCIITFQLDSTWQHGVFLNASVVNVPASDSYWYRGFNNNWGLHSRFHKTLRHVRLFLITFWYTFWDRSRWIEVGSHSFIVWWKPKK
jgi:hypothetical protein